MQQIKLKSSKLFVGVILYHQEEWGFNNAIEALVKSINNLKSDGRWSVELIIKWNSQETFSTDRICRQSGITSEQIFGTLNVGFGAGHNLMMERAFSKGADLYICLNPDGLLHPQALSNLIDFYLELKTPSLVEAIQFPKEHPKPYDPYTGATPWCSGACLMISRDIFEKVGVFDERIFMYCEDIDYSWRVRTHGLNCYTCSAALFFHDVKEKKSVLVRKLMLESARYLSIKWGGRNFQTEIERQLVEDGHYQDAAYIPSISNVDLRFSHSDIPEWRKLLSFSVPRW